MGDHVKVSRLIQTKPSPIYSVRSESDEDKTETIYDTVQVSGGPSVKKTNSMGRKYANHLNSYNLHRD